MNHDSHGYWKATLGLLTKILIIWFLVSFGAGILFADLLNGINKGVSPDPTFDDGVRCQAILDAIEKSAGSKQWVSPEY